MIGMFPPRRDRGEDAMHLRAGATGWARAMVEDARNTELERIQPEDVDRVFYKQPVRNKVLIMMGGPTMNLVLGLALLAGFLLAYGPTLPTTTGRGIPQCVVPASEVRRSAAPRTRCPRPPPPGCAPVTSSWRSTAGRPPPGSPYASRSARPPTARWRSRSTRRCAVSRSR
jgi:membrane-associated protease RseP (regulator of RpoE activity)